MDPSVALPNISGLKKYSASFGQLGDDYIFATISKARRFDFLNEPVRVSGLTICLVFDGRLTLDVNDEQYTMDPNSIMAIGESSVVRITEIDKENIEAYVLFVSTQFLHDVNIDLNSIDLHAMAKRPFEPVVNGLCESERRFLSGIMDLLYQNSTVHDVSMYQKNIARSLIQAVVYQLMLIYASRTRLPQVPRGERPSRKLVYVQEFMHLVQLHHLTERSLSFYAEKLFITPKYLSRIIKEATGRSAADWIDQFVISEAKNMLRFSNKNIQQVAYSLNFPTQSSFGKFFKHLTGMSPSEYQKT